MKAEGSALVLVTLVTAILSLLGISYLMMGDTENIIAENLRNSMLALHAAEAGARMVVGWFNNPRAEAYLMPLPAQADRSERLLDHDGNPATPRVRAVAGDATRPLYKDAAVTSSRLFDRPYGPDRGDSFLGIETGTDPDRSLAGAGPDLIIDGRHLTRINDLLFTNFPTPSLRARLGRIEIYAPPEIERNGIPVRRGIATIKAVGEVVVLPDTEMEQVVATRVVKAVVDRIPIPGGLGPVASCAGLEHQGGNALGWGTVTVAAEADLPGELDPSLPTGLPFARDDPLGYIRHPHTLADWAEEHNGSLIEDPWFKLIAGGAIDEADNARPQPWPHVWPGTTEDDHSNLFQHVEVGCPDLDYRLWKSIARSGYRNHFYYQYQGGGAFRLDGTGPVRTFFSATAGRGGLFFFDTKDQETPNGLPATDPRSNLTPSISIQGDVWGAQGIILLHASDLRTGSLGGIERTIVPPGEPGDGSGFVNLGYPGAMTGGYRIRQGLVHYQTFQDPATGRWYCTDARQCDDTARIPATTPVRDEQGLPFRAPMALDGILHVEGTFIAEGDFSFFGSVIARAGVTIGPGTAGVHFDESLARGTWPREGMRIPRVAVTSWLTNR